MSFKIEILKPEDFLKRTGSEIVRESILYNQPEFMQAVSGNSAFFACLSGGVHGIFPFTGQKWFGKWRIFQSPFCQRFEPFTEKGNTPEPAAWQAWFEWLKNKAWSAKWPFFPIQEFLLPEKKSNQYLQLDVGAESLFQRWKPGRRQAINKGVGLEIKLVPESDFMAGIHEVGAKISTENWKPSATEIDRLGLVLACPILRQANRPYLILLEGKPVACVLIVFWQNRHHYLFSLSSPTGKSKEAITSFMRLYLFENAGQSQVFDFEGSSIPGVRAFFESFGASTQWYGVAQV